MAPKTLMNTQDLAHLEKTLAQCNEMAVERVSDPDMKERLQQIAERHRQQANELSQYHVGEGAPYEAAKDSKIAIGEIQSSRGQDGLMVALSHVEQEQAERYQEAVAASDSQPLREMLARHLVAFDEDQRVFLDESVGMGGIRDPRQTV